MLLADVNVFVYAHRTDSPRHAEHRTWLERALDGIEPFGVSDPVLASVVRLVTNPRIFVPPTPSAVAFEYCALVRAAPAAVSVVPGPRHWAIFEDLCRTVDARGNVVPDAYLAALAIEHGATWVTTDRGFARFPGLQWRVPLD